jgi:hypothetical protein
LLRRLRKHRTALLGIAVANVVFFFPTLFMGRVVSPNDVFRNFSPWNMGRPLDVTQAQNSLLNDPPTAYYSLLALAKSDSRTFHWNPYIASGVPGFGSSAAATLTPFAFLPLLVPLPWLYSAMAFLKLNAAFVFAYLWLREERLGRRGAAIGALVFALAGVYSVRWLWQITNTTVLYPALLWIVRRTTHGRRTPLLVVVLVALAFAISGFPAAIAYGAWIAIAAALRRYAPGGVAAAMRNAIGVIIALLIAWPMLVPFIQLIKRTGYLDVRQATSLAATYPAAQWESFVRPDRMGNTVDKNWTGDKRLGVLNNYVEATVYLGLLTIPLAFLGLRNRRARDRWFWLIVAAFLLACMFGAPGVAPLMAKVPGFKYSALARVGLLLPLPVAYLVAAARLRKQLIYDIAAVVIAFDLALFAGRFHPYLTPEQAQVETTPTIAFLQADRKPFRIAPMQDYLWPNSSELIQVEDIRSHFSSEAAYRRLLQRIEPSSWRGESTVITFHSPTYKFDDPLNGLLGVRWFVEHKYIDIIKWGIFSSTVPGVKQTGTMPLRAGAVLQRDIRIDEEPFYSIEVPLDLQSGAGRAEVTLIKNGAVVWSRAFTRDETSVMSKIYVPLRPYARRGETVTLRVRANNVKGYILQAEDGGFFFGRVQSPVMFDRELPEGRIFRNLAELPRFRAVSSLLEMSDDQFLAAYDIDFEHQSVVSEDLPPLPPSHPRATLTHYAPDEQRIATESAAPFFLASSEKLTPELAITIDGKPARAIRSDMLFAGVPVPAGKHEVVYQRRIGRGWWWTPWVGLVLLAIAIVMGRRRNTWTLSKKIS